LEQRHSPRGSPQGAVIYIDPEPGVAMNWGFIVSFVLVVLGIVGVFIDIPFVSDYAYWFVIASYVILAGSRF
jgi:hypothetical protein